MRTRIRSNLTFRTKLLLLLLSHLYFWCLWKQVVSAFSDQLYFEVKENSPPQTYVGRIPTKPGFTYRFNDEPLEFHLDPDTGVIVTTDVGTDRETKSLYNFVILSSSPTYPIQVKIRILDVNDNWPFWPNYINTNLTFSESAPIGTKVILDNAIDLDEGDLQYKIVYVSDTIKTTTTTTTATTSNNIEDSAFVDHHHDHADDLPFKLYYNASTQFLYLEICSRLDREIQSNYLLNITASDEDGQSSSSMFNVRILDSNDNPPIFDQSDYVVNINESIQKDVSILKVHATDADEPNSDNSRVNYYLKNSDDFKIDPQSGIIYTAHDGPFMCGINNNNGGGKSTTIDTDNDNDYKRICVFLVFAHDFGVPRQDGRAYVTAKIHDRNNHAPIIKFRYFSKSDYAHVDENANNGSVVAAISVIDFDHGPNGQTWLQIGHGNDLNHFRLESIGNSHIIKVNSVLDREKISMYNLTVMAHDRGTPSKSSVDNLIIIVQDHNDHGPKFDRETYECQIVESQYKRGMFVFALHATDQDEGINSKIFYSVSGPNSHFFKIDPNTGLITTDKLIDREQIDQFELRVSARDGGSNPKWAHAILKIQVLDINDQVPVVELLPPNNHYFDDQSKQYEVDIDEGNPLDLHLLIKDQDLGDNGTVDVQILFDYNNLFKIVDHDHHDDEESTSTTTKLVSTRELDFERCNQYRIVLLARDRAPIAQRLSSTTTIVINVGNVDDQLPVLHPRRYYSFIPINAVGSSLNYSVVINKLQIRENEFQIPMHFVIHSRDEVVRQLFFINNQGEMRFKNNVNVRLLKNVPKQFNFEIECVGCKPGHNISNMNVFLLDSDSADHHHHNHRDHNDHHHEFNNNKSVYNFTISEDAAPGTVVGQINTIDTDQFEVYIVQGDPEEQFQMVKNQLTTLRWLDRETKHLYKLRLIAIKENQFFYIDININLTDVNDCQPYFTTPYKVITIQQDAPAMFTILRLNAIDPDLGSDPKMIEYQILENPMEMFMVDRNELKLAKQLDEIGGGGGGGQQPRKFHQLYPPMMMIKVTIKAIDKMMVKINEFENDHDHDVNKKQVRNDDDNAQQQQQQYCHTTTSGNTLSVFMDIKPVYRQRPRFQKKLYQMYLSESTMVNEQFFKIDVNNLNNDSFTYALSGGGGESVANSFGIFPNGQMFVKNPLDREMIDIYLFDIILLNADANANGGGGMMPMANNTSQPPTTTPVDTCRMLIQIKDVNDNRPVFERSSYRFIVPENVSMNFFIGQVKAWDQDSPGPNSQIVYQVVSSYYSSYLDIDPQTGYLWTTINYDRESLPYFEIIVQATDQAIDEDRFTTQTLVRIDIMDINDNRPIFEVPSNVTNVGNKNDDGDPISGDLVVSESTTINTTLAKFHANDLDSESRIHYTLLDPARIASINSSTGQLVLVNELDREQRDNYDLVIEASDGQYKSLFNLKLLVEDVNDCRPTWINFTDGEQQQLWIPENISIGSEIYTFQAMDPDLGSNAMFHFAIENFSGGQKYFDILRQKLVIINPLDYEKTKTHTLNISLIETISNMVASTRMIRINLLDINDCQPVFVRRTETEVVRVLENIDIGTKLLSLQAYDCDMNDVLTYEIISCNTHYHTHRNIYLKEHDVLHKHDSNNCPLKLNTRTGEIININNLDREVIESINLKISVKDTVGHVDRMKVIFIVDDINDESPAFISPNKIVLPKNFNKPNTPVGTVKAVDLDLGVNSAITYKIENTNTPSSLLSLFELDRFSGVFRTRTSSMDPAQGFTIDDTVYVNVSATDGGGLKTFDLIQFILEPDLPYLESINVVLDINENLPISTEISKLECHDSVVTTIDQGCRFHLINATDRNFEVDTFTGIITVVDLIDREMLDKRLLRVLVIGQHHLQIMQVHINIIDQNDNPPYLTNTSIIVHLQETLPIGSQVFDISLLIADEDTNNKFDFQIINCSSSCNGVFSLNRKTGVFTLQSELDCEKVDKYRILFGVSDGIYLLTSLLDIIVVDENDNQPFFNQTDYVFWIEENTERGTIIGQVQAFDADISNKNLVYSLIQDDEEDGQSDGYLPTIFSLDSRSGQFTLSQKLDYEKDPNEFRLLVQASDGKFKSSPIKVTFKLVNLPDNPPVFESNRYQLEVLENKVFHDVLCLQAYDADLKAAADFNHMDNHNVNNNSQKIMNLTYHLDSGNPKLDQDGRIQIDPQTGCISIMKPLDRERIASINLTAYADDGYFNSTAQVYIKVLDENDNHPVFDVKTAKTLKIMENIPIDTVVYTFNALDNDEAPNSYIKYELISGSGSGLSMMNGDQNSTKLPFVIGPIDGILKVTGVIDREQTDQYNIVVRAVDYGLKHTDFECQIDVEDIIDNSPRFQKDHYEINVFENVTVGHDIVKLDAQDDDPTDEINYKIISGDPYGSFRIEDDKIVVAMSLNYEENDVFDLKINAIDRAGNIDTANVRINVLNVLDEKPIFPESSYHVNWFENRLGMVGKFEAFPEDKFTIKKRSHSRSTLPAHINYLLLNNFDDHFHLNSSNAVLSVTKPIDRETLIRVNPSAVLELKVMAIDPISRLSNEADIYVKIIDVNDNAPKFLNDNYQFHLKENQLYDLNTTIGTIETFDPDQDDIITYHLDSDYEDKFAINSNGELSLQSALILDREQQSIYTMPVVISDSLHSVKTEINVLVDDVNDCPPRITKINNVLVNKATMNSNNEFKLKIPMQKLNAILMKNFPIVGLQITDCDDGLNGQIQVRIDDDDLYNVINVDGQNGLIKSDNRNINLQKEILLQIENIDLTIVDQSDTNQLSSHYSIHLEFTDMIDKYREQNLVQKNFVELFISELTPINETLFQFEPMANTIIDEIGIYAGDVYNHFAVADNRLINIKPLDYEFIKSFDLYLQAQNHHQKEDLEEFQFIFLRINIVNENDNPPRFLFPVYNASILEEEEENLFVTQILADDIDSSTTKIKYELVADGGGHGNLPFKIDAHTGHIFTTMKIDRETIDSFKLIATAEDEDGLRSTTTIIVNIEDKNDNPPRFTHLLRTNISENTAVDSFIIQVKSVDKDSGNNSQVTYNLLTETSTFRIDPNNGNIYLMAAIDRETKEEYFLTVSANDGSWKSQTTVTIYVLDENDCHPRFESEEYGFNLGPQRLSMVNNQSIGQVRAVDQDKGSNGLVSYRLKNRSKHFTIDARSGQIFVKQPPKLFGEDLSFLNQHRLIVLASDEGILPKSSQVNVLIRCYPNDNFIDSHHLKVFIPEDLQNGTLLYTSNAIIRLENNDEENRFSTRYNQLLFNGQSNIENGQNYSLIIDNNYEKLMMNITVISANKYAPVFLNPIANSTMVSERSNNHHEEYLINEFIATDQDQDEWNNRIHYSYNVSKIFWNTNIQEYLFVTYKDSYPNLFRKNLSTFELIDQIPELASIKDPFTINVSDGRFYLLHDLDFEIITRYSLLITAKDQAWYSLATSLPHDVWVEDVEDFIGYNLIDSDRLFHSSPKPDPMSIGVMVVIFFFIILILVISTSFFVYHNQKKRLEERKMVINSLRPYADHCQYSANGGGVSRLSAPAAIPEQEIIINTNTNNGNNNGNNRPGQMRLNSSLSHHPQHQQQQPPPLPLPLPSSSSAAAAAAAASSSAVLPPCPPLVSSSNNNLKIQQHPMNSIRKEQQQQQPQCTMSPTRMMMINNNNNNHKQDMMVGRAPSSAHNQSMANQLDQQRIPNVPPTVASSIYTHSNSENYTDNYSNILASAEHYDLENASSIAPSDIDIVYHYKGYRNRDSLHNHHHHQMHHHQMQHHQHHQKHAPLSRLSPSISELSSAHPHILTLQDLSPQPVPPPQPPLMHQRVKNGNSNNNNNSGGSNSNNPADRNLNEPEEENSYAYSTFDDSEKDMFARRHW